MKSCAPGARWPECADDFGHFVQTTSENDNVAAGFHGTVIDRLTGGPERAPAGRKLSQLEANPTVKRRWMLRPRGT
jgi:hypothetical protein